MTELRIVFVPIFVGKVLLVRTLFSVDIPVVCARYVFLFVTGVFSIVSECPRSHDEFRVHDPAGSAPCASAR